MRKSLILIAVILLLTTAIEAKTYYHGGIRYEHNRGLISTVGLAKSLGSNFYEITYGEIGNYGGAVNLETVYFIGLGKGWAVGPFLGPNFVVNNDLGDGLGPEAYLAGASGVLVTKGWSFLGMLDAGLWFGGKYQFDFERDNNFLDGLIVGVGVSVGL